MHARLSSAPKIEDMVDQWFHDIYMLMVGFDVPYF
jgi:hypothetical protein